MSRLSIAAPNVLHSSSVILVSARETEKPTVPARARRCAYRFETRECCALRHTPTAGCARSRGKWEVLAESSARRRGRTLSSRLTVEDDCRDYAFLISIVRGLAGSIFGMCTSSTPVPNFASTCSTSISGGSVKRLSKCFSSRSWR